MYNYLFMYLFIYINNYVFIFSSKPNSLSILSALLSSIFYCKELWCTAGLLNLFWPIFPEEGKLLKIMPTFI